MRSTREILSETPLTYGRITKFDVDGALALEVSFVLESAAEGVVVGLATPGKTQRVVVIP